MNYKIELAKNRQETVILNGYYLHSRYNPLKEAETLAGVRYKKDHVHILIGFGYGYLVKELLNLFSENDKLIVIDPFFDKPLLEVTNKNLIQVFKSELSDLENILREHIDLYDNVTTIISNNYDKVNSSEVELIIDKIKHRVSISKILRNTIDAYSIEWQRNFIYNLKNLSTDSSISNLQGMFDFPIVIASGGPSLSKQIPLLKENREKVLLISAGSTINTLLHYDIEPDFIVSIDGNIANYKHFENSKFNDAVLVYSLLNYFDIRKSFVKDSYYFVTTNVRKELEYILNLTGENPIGLAGGASVATFALSFAMYISNGPICMIGQDLAYTNNKTHAEHNKQFEELNNDLFKSNRFLLVKDQYGEDIYTEYTLLSMKENLESLVKGNDGKNKIFNCTEGGLEILGSNGMRFADFLNEICSDQKISYQLPNGKKTDKTTLINHFENEVKNYSKLEKKLNNILKLLDGIYLKKRFDKKDLDKLDKFDEEFKRTYEKMAMTNILEPITISIFRNYQEGKNETKEQTFNRVYNQNKDIYSSMLKAVKITEVFVKDTLKELKGENNG